MRRLWSITSRQVKSRTVPSPCGWVMTTRAGSVFSQWYRRCKASDSGATTLLLFIRGLLGCGGARWQPDTGFVQAVCHSRRVDQWLPPAPSPGGLPTAGELNHSGISRNRYRIADR